VSFDNSFNGVSKQCLNIYTGTVSNEQGQNALSMLDQRTNQLS
jgi:hypothetical protein